MAANPEYTVSSPPTMQESKSVEIASINAEEEQPSSSLSSCTVQPNHGDAPEASSLEEEEESIGDVSGKTLELSVLGNSSTKALYIYNNTLNLIPRSIREFKGLKTLKFFANDINLFPLETGDLHEIENLEVKVSSPVVSGLPMQKLKSLKELALFQIPPRTSSCFSLLLSEISANLKCLKKLVFCHFAIKYLPPEIGCLVALEHLDISFNKLRSLPNEIACLSALVSLKVANNKLEGLPKGLSHLQKLESLDFSNNRLRSLGSIDLMSMKTLKKLDVQYNKLYDFGEIPSWICCNFEGNGKDELNGSTMNVDKCSNLSSIEECESSDAEDCVSTDKKLNQRSNCQQHMNVDECKTDVALELLTKSTSTSVAECESSSEIDCEDNDMILIQRIYDQQLINVDERETEFAPAALTESTSSAVVECESSSEEDCENSHQGVLDPKIDPQSLCTDEKTSNKEADEQVDDSSLNVIASRSTPKIKRQFEDDVENLKPRKSLRSFESYSYLSNKYSTESFCSIDDHLPNGFYDAGRGRPFMPLESYEQSLCLDSREVLLIDREMDNMLDVITSSAKESVSRSKQTTRIVESGERIDDDNLCRASVLALFVSNWFGGDDRSNLAVKTRKAWSGLNYRKPFVCSCATGNSDKLVSTNQDENVRLIDLCDQNIRNIKQARNSNIVPIGALQWGVCRHRAVLMKYLCDRMVPPIPCELVRGYLDFSSHAWNIVPIMKSGSSVRMVVDACCPTDIREETDPEYFCRYIPSSRIHVSITGQDVKTQSCSFPCPSLCEKIETASSSLLRYSFGSVEAVAKVRTLHTDSISEAEVKKLEYNCLGEVRILGALKKHPCIVEMIGHQIRSTWQGDNERRIIHSAIWMEYIKGGSLKSYIEKIAKDGEKCVQVEQALSIARDIACALAEVHSKHIIHRDIKSENILIDLDRKRADGSPVVKLGDFDMAVPLRSSWHTCCIAHHGLPPPNVCAGTPCWMAPEVVRTMNRPEMYGLEVDIWSYGCVLLELLTLEVPFAGIPSTELHELLQAGQRPPLTEKLEALVSEDEPALAKSCAQLAAGVEVETEILRFLVYLFRQCTQKKPCDRPTAAYLHQKLTACINYLASSKEVDE